MSVTITPIKSEIGVEISGLSRHELVDPGVAEDCQAALDEHGGVGARGCNLDDYDRGAVSRLLGDLVVASTGEHSHPEIQTITLDPSKTNSALAAYRRGNFFWHIDGTHDEVPQKGTLLS